jgi:hypothetical protein
MDGILAKLITTFKLTIAVITWLAIKIILLIATVFIMIFGMVARNLIRICNFMDHHSKFFKKGE